MTAFGFHKDHTQIQGHYDPPSEAPPPAWQIVDLVSGEPLTACDQCGYLYREGDWPLCRGEGGPAAHDNPSMRRFTEFVFDADEGPVTIKSIHQLRELERTSMERWRQGQAGDPRFKDARPYVFRQYSQDPGNRTDRIDIVPNPEKPLQKRTRRGMPYVHPSYKMRED